MGKYDYDNALDYTKVQLLEDIANELAEANRLKRLQLKHTFGGIGLDELEDKA